MEESNVMYEFFTFLKEQNINYWSSIAQIVTSVVLVFAAIWTARIHHKNRKDQNNLKKAPLKVLLHSSAVKKETTISEPNMTGMVPTSRTEGKVIYNIRFVSENTGAFHLIDIKLICIPNSEEHPKHEIPLFFKKEQTYIPPNKGLYIEPHTYVNVLYHHCAYIVKSDIQAEFSLNIQVLKPNGEKSTVTINVSSTTIEYLRMSFGHIENRYDSYENAPVLITF